MQADGLTLQELNDGFVTCGRPSPTPPSRRPAPGSAIIEATTGGGAVFHALTISRVC